MYTVDSIGHWPGQLVSPSMRYLQDNVMLKDVGPRLDTKPRPDKLRAKQGLFTLTVTCNASVDLYLITPHTF